LIGSNLQILKLLSEAQIPRVTEMLEQNAQGNAAELDGLILYPYRRNPITIEIRTFPTQIQGRTVVLGSARDITLHKQLEEELRQALAQEQELGELRTRFVSMVSHDFRTPLAVIQASTHILQTYDDQLNEERRATHFKRILTHIDRMVSLLNDVLVINRADAGATPFHPTHLDLDQFCRAIAEEFQGAPTMQHTLIYALSGEPGEVAVDEKLLHQAIINLLTNAFKYSPEGSTIYFDLSFAENEVIIRVRDRGIGIPLADQPHLFEAFHRAGNVGTIEGTGLGLAIVQRSIEAHGGTVTFESQVGVGTTFIITLPHPPKNGG
ncbi:MAG: HAMP domain-containing histidine kinase, partial [Anaerolineae bacterium]|nr:HAMP domain-containing histidine kinase [Anaerolineae bacterium]